MCFLQKSHCSCLLSYIDNPSPPLSPRHIAVVLQEKKNLVPWVVGEAVVTQPNLCLCYLCRTKSCRACQPGAAAGGFRNVQQFIEGVSSVATSISSASPPSMACLCLPCCWVLLEVICISEVAGWKGLWEG